MPQERRAAAGARRVGLPGPAPRVVAREQVDLPIRRRQEPRRAQARRREDPFAAVRRSFGNDAHPDCGAGPCDGDLAPWRRGDLALIGSTALLFVRGPNKQMGTNRNDCAVAGVVDGLAVLDRLDESYGNMIDHKRSLAQKEIFKTGLEGVLRDFPKTDILEGVSWVPEVR